MQMLISVVKTSSCTLLNTLMMPMLVSHYVLTLLKINHSSPCSEFAVMVVFIDILGHL